MPIAGVFCPGKSEELKYLDKNSKQNFRFVDAGAAVVAGEEGAQPAPGLAEHIAVDPAVAAAQGDPCRGMEGMGGFRAISPASKISGEQGG